VAACSRSRARSAAGGDLARRRENIGAAQQALFHRADCNRAARRGEYDAVADAPSAA
jgi:hypothetical protein